jgi:cyclopropane fatty-acyl-phospholipid synthase-like methyltransferase
MGVVAPEKDDRNGSQTGAADALLAQSTAFYEHKTLEILRRYGPGPRVHYHTGLADEPPSPSASPQKLRSELLEAQEHALRYAARLWEAETRLTGDVLDVGCGLGGGSIFWAQEYGAHVTAVTIAPSHIELVRKFAAEAGVSSRVVCLLCDASAVPGESCFHAAVAIDSSSSFPRRPWFRRLSRLLRPGGRVFIFDCFLGRADYAEPFNRHWCCQIGTIDEYVAAARESRLTVDAIKDVSLQALHFWTRTLALMHLEAQDTRCSPSEYAKLDESLRLHALVRRGLIDGGLCHLLVTFTRH